MPVISAAGVGFHVQRLDPPGPLDGAPTVVFVHGLVIDNLSSFFYTVAGPVVAAGARVILYDLRGHGLSERTAGHYSTQDAVADLCALLDALGETDRVYLVGNSFGGLIAARTAITVPERVAGLMLIEASCAGQEAAAWLEDMTNTLTLGALRLEYDHEEKRLATFDERRFVRHAVFADALLNGTTLIDDLAMERPLSTAELAAIRCPVLAVFGDHSELAGAADELAQHVRDCTVEFLPGVAHTVLREATGPLRDILIGWLPTAGDGR